MDRTNKTDGMDGFNSKNTNVKSMVNQASLFHISIRLSRQFISYICVYHVYLHRPISTAISIVRVFLCFCCFVLGQRCYPLPVKEKRRDVDHPSMQIIFLVGFFRPPQIFHILLKDFSSHSIPIGVFFPVVSGIEAYFSGSNPEISSFHQAFPEVSPQSLHIFPWFHGSRFARSLPPCLPVEDVHPGDQLVLQSLAEATPWPHGAHERWVVLLHDGTQARDDWRKIWKC